MRYVVSHHVFHEKHRNEYAQRRIYEEENVAAVHGEIRRERGRYQMYQSLQYQGGETAEKAYYQRQNHHKGTLLHMLLAPQERPEESLVYGIGYIMQFLCHL